MKKKKITNPKDVGSKGILTEGTVHLSSKVMKLLTKLVGCCYLKIYI